MSPDSMFKNFRLKSWLKLILPTLLVILGLGLSKEPLIKSQSLTHVHSELQQAPSKSLALPQLARLPASRQPVKHSSRPPLFFLTSEDSAPDSQLLFKELLTLLGFLLIYSLTLTVKWLNSSTLARMLEVAVSPLLGLKHSPTFILLQIFRL